ncbi:MAG TPA: periplasmic heavy metal sensor [candidate division Zixibacteria bacterium]|nr:periplasmic heavy metal sensor [candidate division Zixibacteria bacterium]
MAAFLVLLAFLLPSAAAAGEQPRPAFHEELGESWNSLGRELRELLGRWRWHFDFESSWESQPLISLMLRNRERLGLSAEQVRRLEALRDGYEKKATRVRADIRVAEIDLAAVLKAEEPDMTKVEAQVREIEKLRADLRIERIRTIERAKQQLSAEQRRKLEELRSERRLAQTQPAETAG